MRAVLGRSTFSCFALVMTGLVWAANPPRSPAESDLDHRLRYEYGNKTLVLRDFYHGSRLTFDAGGRVVGNFAPGDWTLDGFVRVRSLKVDRQHLKIVGERLSVVSGSQGLQLQYGIEKSVRIEIALDSSTITVDQAEATIARVFLTSNDHLVDMVPDYWKPCVRIAATPNGAGKNQKTCRFSQDFFLIPGMNWPVETRSEQGHDSSEQSEMAAGILRVGKGVTPPRVVLQTDPDFSKEAREAKYQGTLVIGLTVTKTGDPSNIYIVSPLGFGLDRRAVETVAKWRFAPARKDGEPVDAKIMVEVDFHLY